MGTLWGGFADPDVPRGLYGYQWRCYGVALGSLMSSGVSVGAYGMLWGGLGVPDVPMDLYGDAMGWLWGPQMSPWISMGTLWGGLESPGVSMGLYGDIMGWLWGP